MDKVIEQLAAQLGTTAEYLWSVLIKQAPISGAIDLMVIAVIAAAWVVLFYRRAPVIKWIEDHDAAPPAFAALIGLLICTLIVFFSISNVITAFANPEYWAFQKVLRAIK